MNILEMTDAQYESWLAKASSGATSAAQVTEEGLVTLVSAVMRSTDARQRAIGFADVAKLALALSDKIASEINNAPVATAPVVH